MDQPQEQCPNGWMVVVQSMEVPFHPADWTYMPSYVTTIKTADQAIRGRPVNGDGRPLAIAGVITPAVAPLLVERDLVAPITITFRKELITVSVVLSLALIGVTISLIWTIHVRRSERRAAIVGNRYYFDSRGSGKADGSTIVTMGKDGNIKSPIGNNRKAPERPPAPKIPTSITIPAEDIKPSSLESDRGEVMEIQEEIDRVKTRSQCQESA